MSRLIQEVTLVDSEGNSHEYETTQFAAMAGIRLSQKILKVAAEPLGELMNAFQKAGHLPDEIELSALLEDDSIDSVAIARAVAKFAENLDPMLILQIFGGTTRDGINLSQEALFDSAYTANYPEFFKAFIWVLTVNFEDVFPVLKSASTKKQKASKD